MKKKILTFAFSLFLPLLLQSCWGGWEDRGDDFYLYPSGRVYPYMHGHPSYKAYYYSIPAPPGSQARPYGLAPSRRPLPPVRR